MQVEWTSLGASHPCRKRNIVGISIEVRQRTMDGTSWPSMSQLLFVGFAEQISIRICCDVDARQIRSGLQNSIFAL